MGRMTSTLIAESAQPFEPLGKVFMRRSRLHTQIRREGNVAIYQLDEPDWPSSAFEVIIIQHRPAGEVFGKEVPEREAYPGSEMWGKAGWTCINLVSAEAKFRLVQKTIRDRNTEDGQER